MSDSIRRTEVVEISGTFLDFFEASLRETDVLFFVGDREVSGGPIRNR
jgi:hypothetical protein